jgi:hypothetical protein
MVVRNTWRFCMRHSLHVGALGVLCTLSSCGDDLPLAVTDPPVVITLDPALATVRVGDTTRFVGTLSGGSPITPPRVASCKVSSPLIASVSLSLAGCTVVGVSPGTTDVSVMASTGQEDTARVVVVPR